MAIAVPLLLLKSPHRQAHILVHPLSLRLLAKLHLFKRLRAVLVTICRRRRLRDLLMRSGGECWVGLATFGVALAGGGWNAVIEP